MEQITWVCKDCGYSWVGDEIDSWCPACDELNIISTSHITERRS